MERSGHIMRRRGKSRRAAFTLLEVTLVVGLLVVIASLAIPNLLSEFERKLLPGSARQLRSLLTLVSANAAFDGKRYRIRFPEEDEEDQLGGRIQPLIEREDDPIDEPDEWYLVTAPWTLGKTMLRGIWCGEVRLGRPTAERLLERRSRIADALAEQFEEFTAERLPLIFEPDGTSGWATFVVVDGPYGVDVDNLEDYPRIELIWEGETGLGWLQRPFYEEELDLFEEKNWPVVLRQDFLNPRVLTEDDVLELRDAGMPRGMKSKEADLPDDSAVEQAYESDG